MKATPSPIREQGREPAECEIGDWIIASNVPDWNDDPTRSRIYFDPAGQRETAFKLLPDMNGKRQMVWIRIG
jgi:hypothetical protein